MPWTFHYTTAIWPSLVCAAFVAALGLHVWLRRYVPGARPLAWMLALGCLWALGTALELAAADTATASSWSTFTSLLLMPVVTIRFGFVLEYTDPGRALSRLQLAALAFPILVATALLLSSDLHVWAGLGYAISSQAGPFSSPASWVLTTYAYVLTLAGIALLARLFGRSPAQRVPVALIIVAQIISQSAFTFDSQTANPATIADLTVVGVIVSQTLYALALFRYHMFDPIPIARETVIEQMHEGMLVLDREHRVVDLNRAAEAMFGRPKARMRGLPSSELLPGWGGPGEGSVTASEVSLGAGDAERVYALHPSPLQDARGLLLGTLVFLWDITGQKRAQAQIMEQQRLVATLSERQQLARELHDGTAQVLAYVGVQARAISKLLRDGDVAAAQTQSRRLAGAADEAHGDIRNAIRDLRVGSEPGSSLFASLGKHLDSFSAQSGISTALVIDPGLHDSAFRPEAGSQLLRVIQEATTNARKHGAAASVKVTLERLGEEARITVADDGRGFDLGAVPDGRDGHLGLSYMRERMKQVGGTMAVRSQPGAGTEVVLRVPIGAGA